MPLSAKETEGPCCLEDIVDSLVEGQSTRLNIQQRNKVLSLGRNAIAVDLTIHIMPPCPFSCICFLKPDEIPLSLFDLVALVSRLAGKLALTHDKMNPLQHRWPWVLPYPLNEEWYLKLLHDCVGFAGLRYRLHQQDLELRPTLMLAERDSSFTQGPVGFLDATRMRLRRAGEEMYAGPAVKTAVTHAIAVFLSETECTGHRSQQ
ncbi:hypothetical protein JCM8547_007711 [Rhodosporidiobolus lusitaniae]